jgi:hypothetical protein
MRSVSIGVTGAVLVAVAGASAALYVPTDLGTLGGQWAAVSAISSAGHVAGCGCSRPGAGRAQEYAGCCQ